LRPFLPASQYSSNTPGRKKNKNVIDEKTMKIQIRWTFEIFKEMSGLPRLILLNTHKTFKIGKVKGIFLRRYVEHPITASTAAS